MTHASRAEELSSALRRPCDLVVVAGGDGTVGKAAHALVGSDVPLAIFPLGTANNIARCLGFDRPITELIKAWPRSDRRGFDASVGTVDGESLRFFESFGFGAFPETMVHAQRKPEEDDADSTLDRDRRLVRAVVASASPCHYEVTIDGHDRSGDYLLVEIMNISCLGPRVAIAPRAEPSDGALDVVLLGEQHRAMLLAHLDDLLKGSAPEMALPAPRARHVVVSAPRGARCHHDGELRGEDGKEPRPVDITIEPHAFQVLVPRSVP